MSLFHNCLAFGNYIKKLQMPITIIIFLILSIIINQPTFINGKCYINQVNIDQHEKSIRFGLGVIVSKIIFRVDLVNFNFTLNNENVVMGWWLTQKMDSLFKIHEEEIEHPIELIQDCIIEIPNHNEMKIINVYWNHKEKILIGEIISFLLFIIDIIIISTFILLKCNCKVIYHETVIALQ